MPAPAVIVNVFGKVDGFLTGWGPTRNPEGPQLFYVLFLSTVSVCVARGYSVIPGQPMINRLGSNIITSSYIWPEQDLKRAGHFDFSTPGMEYSGCPDRCVTDREASDK
jgi:hypothetical protein